MATSQKHNDAMDTLLHGVVEVLNVEELEHKLAKQRPLVIKAGFDPTSADLHLGHLVLLNKLRDFQELGHSVCFVVGDFTGLVGDPSGRDVTRPPMTQEALQANAQTYADQVFKVLDKDKTEIRFNSAWLNELSLAETLHLTSQYTVARMLERDDFSARYSAGQGICLHEFLYPLMQGYDSVVLKADIELGGNDQKFNLLMGRHLQKAWQQEPQVVMMLPLLVGLDGKRKMSKSLDNYIGIDENPAEMFGKLMSLSDDLMWDYLSLVGSKSADEVSSLQQTVAEGKNPRDIKMDFACDLITRFHSASDATNAKQDFIQRFSKNLSPDEMESAEVIATGDSLPLFKVLQLSGLTSSSSEAQRMVNQGAVKIDGAKVEDPNTAIPVGDQSVYQVGKRRFKKISLVSKS